MCVLSLECRSAQIPIAQGDTWDPASEKELENYGIISSTHIAFAAGFTEHHMHKDCSAKPHSSLKQNPDLSHHSVFEFFSREPTGKGMFAAALL